MRTFLRTIAATAALSALLLGVGAGSALAAPVDRYTFDDAWCFDFGSQVDCTVSHGTLFVTVKPDGSEVGRIVFRETVDSFDPSGVQIGTFRTWSFDRTVFADGGQDSTFVVDHYRGDGLFADCHGSSILKIVDYTIQVDHQTGPHCS